MQQVTYQIELDREELDTVLKALEVYRLSVQANASVLGMGPMGAKLAGLFESVDRLLARLA